MISTLGVDERPVPGLQTVIKLIHCGFSERTPSVAAYPTDPTLSGKSFSLIQRALIRGVVWALVRGIF